MTRNRRLPPDGLPQVLAPLRPALILTGLVALVAVLLLARWAGGGGNVKALLAEARRPGVADTAATHDAACGLIGMLVARDIRSRGRDDISNAWYWRNFVSHDLSRLPNVAPLLNRPPPMQSGRWDGEPAVRLAALLAQHKALTEHPPKPLDCAGFYGALGDRLADPGVLERARQTREAGDTGLYWYSRPLISGDYALVTWGRMDCYESRAGNPLGRPPGPSVHNVYATYFFHRDRAGWVPLAAFRDGAPEKTPFKSCPARPPI